MSTRSKKRRLARRAEERAGAEAMADLQAEINADIAAGIAHGEMMRRERFELDAEAERSRERWAEEDERRLEGDEW